MPTPTSHLHRRRAVAASVLALVLVGAACSSSDGTAAPPNEPAGSGTTSTPAAATEAAFPGDRWALTDPGAAGLRPGPLAEITAAVAGTDTDCVAVVKGGELVHESTYDGVTGETDQVVFSVSKSLTSVLVGIAQEQGKLRIDQRASDFVPEWKGTPSEAVTIEQLLSMTSGRFYTAASDYVTMPRERDQSAYAVGLSQQHPPGTHWEYNNAGVQVLEVVLRTATGKPVRQFADEVLFGPIGVQMDWVTDATGHPWTYGGARLSCRDLARVGLLMQRHGRWGDRQVVPEAWVAESTRRSQDLNPAYGYLWWLNAPGRAATDGTGGGGAPAATTTTAAGDAPDGRPHPKLGPDAYSANGLGGQFILVAPTEDLVIIRTGGAKPAEGRPGAREVLRLVTDRALAAAG